MSDTVLRAVISLDAFSLFPNSHWHIIVSCDLLWIRVLTFVLLYISYHFKVLCCLNNYFILTNYFYLGTMNWMAPEVLERPYPFQQFWKYCSTFTCWPTLMWNQFGKSLLNHDYYIVFHQRFFAVLVIFIVWRVSVWFDYL